MYIYIYTKQAHADSMPKRVCLTSFAGCCQLFPITLLQARQTLQQQHCDCQLLKVADVCVLVLTCVCHLVGPAYTCVRGQGRQKPKHVHITCPEQNLVLISRTIGYNRFFWCPPTSTPCWLKAAKSKSICIYFVCATFLRKDPTEPKALKSNLAPPLAQLTCILFEVQLVILIYLVFSFFGSNIQQQNKCIKSGPLMRCSRFCHAESLRQT